ncbi:hypothetical protein F5Y03DRAFT_23230 [Xylaria venustula]|nr:hypothetical protein F5Y03DRAFT_23230 [Xylaria venustula]
MQCKEAASRGFDVRCTSKKAGSLGLCLLVVQVWMDINHDTAGPGGLGKYKSLQIRRAGSSSFFFPFFFFPFLSLSSFLYYSLSIRYYHLRM